MISVATNSNVNQVIELRDLTNQEFFVRHAGPGRVGLVGGTTLIDRAICHAQRHLDEDKNWSCWSHAFLLQGERPDGHHWVIESDLDFHRKHIRLGVQENRLAKYFDENLHSTLAILDFGLTTAQTAALLREGLNLVADHTRYSVRELFGTLIGLTNKGARTKGNLLAREKSFYCSAFVQHLFRQARIDLVPGLDVKHTAPEDLARSPVPHTTYLLKRAVATGRLQGVRDKLRVRRLRKPAK